MRVASLVRYPVKSLRGHSSARARIEARGIAGDRRWMIVDPAGRFVTRRDVPAMARIDVRAAGDTVWLDHPDLGRCVATIPPADGPSIGARIWRDTMRLQLGNASADHFLGAALERPVHLAYQPNDSVRPVEPGYALSGDQVSLADGFPLLVTSPASLDALNAGLAVPVPMERFRPNIVVEGADAWAEDGWRRLRIGRVVLRIVKPCSRCVIVTQQPLTGERLEGNEPLTTLRAMGRMATGGVMFGQNAIPESLGTIAVGDRVEVLEHGPSNLQRRDTAAANG